MDELEHRPWTISIQAKSRALCFRLRASHLLTSCGNGGSRLSLFLCISNYLFQVRSETGVLARGETRCSKLLHFLGKFSRPKSWGFTKYNRRKKGFEFRKPRNEIPGNNAGLCQFQDQGSMATMMGSLSLLSHSTSEKDLGGIIIHTFVLCFYLNLLFGRKKSPFPLVLVSMVVSAIAYSLNCTSCIDHVPKAAWQTWIGFLSFGCLTALFQDLYSRIVIPFWRNRLRWLILLAVLPLLFIRSLINMSSESMKAAVEWAPVWISNLLLTCQAIIHVLGEPKNPKAIGVYLSSAYFWVKETGNILSPYMQTWLVHA